MDSVGTLFSWPSSAVNGGYCWYLQRRPDATSTTDWGIRLSLSTLEVFSGYRESDPGRAAKIHPEQALVKASYGQGLACDPRTSEVVDIDISAASRRFPSAMLESVGRGEDSDDCLRHRICPTSSDASRRIRATPRPLRPARRCLLVDGRLPSDKVHGLPSPGA